MENGYIFVNNNIFHSLFAISEDEQSRGLMFEAWRPPVMSFIYSYPKINKFWMKNTPSPLDIIFCCDGEVQQIHYGKPYSTTIIGDDKTSDLVIEFPHGTILETNIKIGHKVGIVSPSSNQLKKIIATKCR